MPGVWDGKEGLVIPVLDPFSFEYYHCSAIYTCIEFTSKKDLTIGYGSAMGMGVWIRPCFCQQTSLIPPQTFEMWLTRSGSRPRR